jgi:hypothetical protein
MLNRLTGRNGSADTDAPELPPPSAQDLKHQLAEKRQRLGVLVAERASLALPATAGKNYAQKRIAEIDTERSTLAAQVETIEQALVTLKHHSDDPLAHHRAGFKRDYGRRLRVLHAVVIERVDYLVRHVERLLHSREEQQAARCWMGLNNNPNGTYFLDEIHTPEQLIERLKQEEARLLCSIPDASLIVNMMSNREAAQKRKDAAHELQSQLVAELCRDPIKPPAHLIATHTSLVASLKQRAAKIDDAEVAAINIRSRRRK